MITVDRYEALRRQLRELGHGGDYTWSQDLKPPRSADDFACEYTWVVLNSGMKNTVARGIMDRIWPLVVADIPIGDAFKHPGKRNAIETVWRLREDYFSCFNALADGTVVDWCQTLPWIGKITKYHLAKNLGADVAKPDLKIVAYLQVKRLRSNLCPARPVSDEDCLGTGSAAVTPGHVVRGPTELRISMSTLTNHHRSGHGQGVHGLNHQAGDP